jgi:hypothetical protein
MNETEGKIGAVCLSRVTEAEIERKKENGLNKVVAGVPATDFETFWKKEIEAVRATYQEVITTHPEAKRAIEKVHEILTDIVSLDRCTRTVWCLFTRLYGAQKVLQNSKDKEIRQTV